VSAFSEAPSGYGMQPYCGSPPSPDSLLTRWNGDPLLIAALLLLLAAYVAFNGRRSGGEPTVAPWRQGCFCVGWGLGALALISPLCALSVSLFSARVAQHMLIATIVAPLIALGLPGRSARGQALPAAAVYAACLWVWHAPGPYVATFHSDVVYWLMHVTTFAAALWLWRALLDGSGDRLAGFVAASALTTGQMGLLGAILTFSARPLYPPHQLTTQVWGLTPLEDQQLGGAVMWIPAGLIFVGALAFAFTEALRRAEARAIGRSLA
jgi:putative membrane protein